MSFWISVSQFWNLCKNQPCTKALQILKGLCRSHCHWQRRNDMQMVKVNFNVQNFDVASLCCFRYRYKTNVFKFLLCKYLITIFRTPLEVPNTPADRVVMGIALVDTHFALLREASLCQRRVKWATLKGLRHSSPH